MCLELFPFEPKGSAQGDGQSDHPAFDGGRDDLPGGGRRRLSLGIGGVAEKGEKEGIYATNLGRQNGGSPADVGQGRDGLDPVGPEEGEVCRRQRRVSIFPHHGQARQYGLRVRQGSGEFLLEVRIPLGQMTISEKGSASQGEDQKKQEQKDHDGSRAFPLFSQGQGKKGPGGGRGECRLGHRAKLSPGVVMFVIRLLVIRSSRWLLSLF